MKEHVLDATNQSFGRLASKVATILRGKTEPSFMPNLLPSAKVIVKNLSKIKFTGAKLSNKTYFHYSGYPGGMKERNLGEEFSKNPERVFKSTVMNMLAQNRLRSKIIKNLIFDNK